MTFTLSVQELVAEAESGAQAGLLARHKSWERVRLGDVAHVQNGAAFSSRLFNVDGKGLPLVRIRDVGRGESNTYYSGEYETRYLVNPGDILVGMDGDFRVAVWSGPQSLLNQRVCKISVRRRDFYDERFLALALQGYLNAVWEKTSAVTVKHLSSRTVEDIPLPFPPISEQRRIVAAIESHLARIEPGARGLRRVLTRVDVLRRSVRQWAVCGGQPSGQDLPEGWRWGALRDVVKGVDAGKSFTCLPRAARPGEWGVVKVSAMTWGRFRPEENKAVPYGFTANPSHRIEAGDVLLSRANTADYVGASVMVRGDHPNLLLSDKSLRLSVGAGVDKEWLLQVLSSPIVRRQISDKATGTKDSMRNISQQALLDVRIPIPPQYLQARIAVGIAGQLDGLDRLHANISAVLRQAEHLYVALLTSAFSGRLVPQDPNDEPAAELLARIRAERAVAIPKQRTRARRTPKELAAPPTRVTGDDYQQETLPL
ncbi:restriction endonuclease subunit S [Micromonospora sp. NPDC049081]|uniref:restriction endonuclease subunit S n=1 Tax=Micromonospora sp. NPDC049081 TaxID=3155150 RepID=UPI0033EF901F